MLIIVPSGTCGPCLHLYFALLINIRCKLITAPVNLRDLSKSLRDLYPVNFKWQWLSVQSLASHLGPGSVPGLSVCDLW